MADTAREALEARGADLCLAATLQVFQRDAKQQGPTAENPYYSPDTMMPAALELRAAGVQFLRAAGQATPAYTGVLAAGPVRFSPRSRVAHEHPAIPRPLRLCVSASRGDVRLLRGGYRAFRGAR